MPSPNPRHAHEKATSSLTHTRSLFPPEGLVQAGKLRRSRPILGKLDSSPRDTPSANDDGDLPPGCTIVDRNSVPAQAMFATAGRGFDADPVKTSKSTAKPLLEHTQQSSDGDGVVAAGRSPPIISTTSSQQRPAARFGGTISETKHEGVTAVQHVAPAGTRQTLRYNPGPTFRKARGRKKKALLDPSEVTEGSVIGVKELTALLEDATLQQVLCKCQHAFFYFGLRLLGCRSGELRSQERFSTRRGALTVVKKKSADYFHGIGSIRSVCFCPRLCRRL